ncbi:HAD family phosphatase [Kocuria coralli]|uniref:HAD family phosphatase n=1 Tax=Kocuria coralli TaxID=1461025 RepID=A0A5J5L0A1_9MICC|nr:HAD family phosphatase [Kocuria coralli]KAA9395379.1 HAD family phosphatase [Kocuria coralli]
MADHQSTLSTQARPLDPGYRPSAVVFDCDGVLLDTESVWTEVQEAMFTRHGLPFDQDEQRRMMGWSARSVAREVATLSGTDADAAFTEILATEAEFLEGHLPMIDGAMELLRRVAARVPAAVASNSTRQILDTKMNATGIGEHVRTWVSSDDTPPGKPEPDIYLEAARRLGVEPARCLAIEDSPAGAAAAIAAGMVTVGVSADPDAHPVPSSVLVTSLLDPALEQLLVRWGW